MGLVRAYLAAATAGWRTALSASSMILIASSTSLFAMFSGGDMRITFP